ncbi:hypothetical protein Salat_0067900 [Sesamum alatum]|uniref:Uncharacterized protein n=1 Tax=Sesamum alatum TaxID=300844 RepID=A0AAE1YV43_9LAMI|nr:hypothetical protein Salat_0067900 [Sesamum alatum]
MMVTYLQGQDLYVVWSFNLDLRLAKNTVKSSLRCGKQGHGPLTELHFGLVVYGLRCNIQKEMAILSPSSISQAIGLAKLLESKHQDHPFLSYAHPLMVALVRRVLPPA